MSKLVAKNALILSFVEILGKAIEFFSFVVLARMLGVEKYGVLNFVYTISTTFTLLPHFGFDQLVARDIPRQQEKTGAYLIGISIAKIFLFAATVVLLWIWLEFFSHFDSSKKTLLYLGLWGVFFLSNIMFTSAFFRAYQRATIEAGIRIMMAIVVMVASIVTVLISTDLFNLLMVRLFVAVGIFLLSIYQIVTMLKPNLRGVLKEIDIASYLQKGWPFAVFIFFTAIYVSIDIVMLSLMAGDLATGFYSVATKIIIFFILIPTGIGNAVMPAMSEKVKSDFDGFLSLAHSATRYLLILSILAVMFNMFLGQEIIHLLFGKEYAKSGLILMLLSWSLVPSYLNHIWNAMLLSFNKEKSIIIFAVIGAASNISMNLVLIPKYSYYGAALATILTEVVVVIIQYLYIKRKILPQVRMFVDNRMILLMGIGIIFSLGWFCQKWLWVGFVPAILIYIFVLFKFEHLSKEEFVSFARYLLKKGRLGMFSKLFKRAPSPVKSFLVKDGKPKFDPRRKGYVILCYHSIGVKQDYRYTTTVEDFEEQLAHLRKFFKLVTLKEIVEKMKSGGAFSGIEVAVTFDDGFRDNQTHALPLLTKYHIPATIFINTAMAQTGYRTFLNWEQIRTMAEHPLVSFESHGCTHSPLTALEREDVLHEMIFSKKELELRINKPVDIFSYPFGIFNQHVVEMAKEAGYHAACCAGVDLERGRDLWRMNRLVVDESHANLDNFAYELTEEVTVI